MSFILNESFASIYFMLASLPGRTSGNARVKKPDPEQKIKTEKKYNYYQLKSSEWADSQKTI